jgi:hypothetical protein
MKIVNVNFIVLTDAHSRAFPKRDVCVVWSTLLIFFCEPFWIEFLRFWEVLRIMLESHHGDVNSSPRRQYYCVISRRGRKFVVTAALPV